MNWQVHWWRGTLNSGAITTSGAINLNGDNLQFPNTLNQYKINLYGTNIYGFGIAGGTIQYSSQSNHAFYNSSNNVNTFNIDSVGNTSCIGQFTNGSASYMYAGGLGVNGADTGNTFYQNAINIGTYPANIGFTLRDANTFNFNSLSSTGGGYTNILYMNTSGIALNKNTSMNATATFLSSSSKWRIHAHFN